MDLPSKDNDVFNFKQFQDREKAKKILGEVVKNMKNVIGPKLKLKTTTISVRIPEKLKRMITEKAVDECRTPNQLIFLLICRGLGIDPRNLDKEEIKQ